MDEGAVLDAGVEPGAEAAAGREAIEWALARVDAQQREAFLMKYVEELSYEEMADLTGAGISALKMRVKRACERLRVMLREVERV
jgi:RNA polymerase sigma-70 factor (ECF subfamily)